jgi:2-iminobutanoate/2-iminopropanoate deaminase
VYLQDIKDFDRMNDLYEEFFGAHKPARTVVEVANNPKGISFYLDAIASLK